LEHLYSSLEKTPQLPSHFSPSFYHHSYWKSMTTYDSHLLLTSGPEHWALWLFSKSFLSQ
jgi:lipocalin